MTFDPGGKQPVGPHGPSHLRQEVRPELSPGGFPFHGSVVQVPDSQVVVPETQFGDVGHQEYAKNAEHAGVTNPGLYSNRDDELFVLRTQAPKRVPGAQATIKVKYLHRPTEAEQPSFSPFMTINHSKKANQNMNPNLKSQDTSSDPRNGIEEAEAHGESLKNMPRKTKVTNKAFRSDGELP